MLCRLLSLFGLLVVGVSTTTAGFLSVGDWGSASLGGYHQRDAVGTAAAMKAYIAAHAASTSAFVLNTGDNFYYCGIQNTSDPQITEDYSAVFGGMGVPWYNSLGNHDYGFAPEAQLALNETIPEWIMDARYYHRREVIPDSGGSSGGITANIIVLDTNPCVKDYRGEDRRRWDPCGTQYPDCSPIAEPCRFHENILSQDCDAQLEWVKGVLASIPSNHTEWVFVVGHHKAEEINVADFQSAFLDDPRVHLYLNGHKHNLEHYSVNGQAKYMTTGAGGMVLIGGDERDDAMNRAGIPAVKSLWSKVVSGFSSHTFTDNGKTLTTEFWDGKKNETIYSFDTRL
jgi:tartrate-resistant acid phosphatase type 5